jgi:TctA family transporter
MNADAVFWGAIITVAISTIVVVFLGFKIVQLMKRDEEAKNK